jgi:hypothetical protein
MEVSPKYLMKLVDQIEKKIWEEFGSYKKVKSYIKKWHFAGFSYENFPIVFKSDETIDLAETLHNIEGETLIKIGIDLGIETPDFIPSIPLFKNNLKNNYQRASSSFEEACRKIEDQPSISIGLANSTLESIIKYILEDESIKVKWNERDTLYKQTQNILKELNMFPSEDIPSEIRNIGSGLLSVSQNIEDLRSGKTLMHGKTDNGYMIEDPLYSGFIVNAVATVGLFLINFYEKKYKKNTAENEEEVKIENIPF